MNGDLTGGGDVVTVSTRIQKSMCGDKVVRRHAGVDRSKAVRYGDRGARLRKASAKRHSERRAN